MIHLVNNIRTPKLPLSGYADFTKFKIYLLDTGLLGAMLNITSDIIINPTKLFAQYNGAFIENFVATELIKLGIKDLFYWTSNSDAEVDFIIQYANEIFPLEVKSGSSVKMRSLKSYADKYNPFAVFRISPRNFIKREAFINLPLYRIFLLTKLFSQLVKKEN